MQECERDITVGLANVTAMEIKEQAGGRGSEIKLFKVQNLKEAASKSQ